MPPKGAKKGSAKKGNAVAAVFNKNWEADLTKAPFEEESWQACVSLVVGRSPEDEELIQGLSLAVQKPQRKLFSLLTWDSTIAKIHELGNPKAKKPDDLPVFYEAAETAKALLDAGEEITCDLMAKLLKFQLLQIKTSDQRRREAEQAEEEKAKAVPASATKDKGGAKVSDKKGKSPPSPGDPSKDRKSKLKRRDDVEPPKFIDDEPEDGPQHYILLLGFHQPQLIGDLDAIGVHVANVIKLCSKHAQTSEGQEEHQAEAHGSEELAAQARKLDLFWSGLRPVLDSGPQESRLHDVVQLSHTAPNLCPPVLTQDPEAELEIGSMIFEDVANLIYDCLDWRRQHQHYLDSMKLISVLTVIRLEPQPAEVLPTPLMTPRSKRKSVREGCPPETEPPPLSTDVDMRYYNNLLELVPHEACSVPLIMHCMLEQVEISAEQALSNVSEEPKAHTGPGLDYELLSFMLQRFLSLVHTEEERSHMLNSLLTTAQSEEDKKVEISAEQALSNVSEEPKAHTGPGLDYELLSFMLQRFLSLVHTEEERSHMLNSLLTTAQSEEDKKKLAAKFGAEETQKKSEHPLVIRHHNERALRLRDISAVQGFDPAEVELSMMRMSPIWELIQSVAQQRNNNSCWMSVKQQLQHYCTDDVVSWLEVENLIHQSVFESMRLTKLDQKGELVNGSLGTLEPEPPTVIPWDSPLSYAEQELDKLRTKGPTFLTGDSGNTEISGSVCSQLALSDIQSCRLRSLFDWHYAEHHSASIFPQVLQLASEEYRCLDTFRGSHNNILYIFCHNPMSPDRQCKENWDAAVHTDVGFRKYLEHVADSISDWTEEEELKREAIELQNLSPAESPTDEKTTDSAEEQQNILEPVIRKGSLKAWKLEQEQLKEEEPDKKSKKENKPKGKQQKDEKADNKTSKMQTSGRKSRAQTAAGSLAKTPAESITTTEPPVEEDKEQDPIEELFNGFTGYSMDGKLIHVSGRQQDLFPSDGGRITVENVSYVEGSSLMKVAVKKDGHHFYTHVNHVVVDPVKPPQQSPEKENNVPEPPVQMYRVKQGSLSAVLDNGIHLSYSFYGPTGEYRVSPQEPEQGASETSAHQSKGTDLDSASHTRPVESQSKVCADQPASSSNPFNSLNLSVPNGLLLQFLREDTKEEQGVLVKQSFPLHGNGQLPDPSLSKELSRIVTNQGAVIRYMRDGSTEVLFADGSVSFSQDSGPVWVPDSEVEEENVPQETEDKEQSSAKDADDQRGCWVTTTPTGARICTVGTTHKHIPTTRLLAYRATDPITNEVMLVREDLVVSVLNSDGSLSVEHADGTRITSLHQDRPQHILLHTGLRPESVTLRSTSECACGCSQCVCVTRCADSVHESVHTQDTCDNGAEISGDSAGKSRDKDELSDGRESSVYNNNKNGEVFADDAVAKKGDRSECESDKGSVSSKERVVLVEKEGCATVVMYLERRTAHVFLADGTVITGDNQGAYQVFPSSVGLLQVQSDGKCVYSSDPRVTPTPKGGTPTNQSGSYAMSHTDRVACDVTDPDGNHFQVMEDGQVSVLSCSPAPSPLKQDEEEPEEEEEDREMAGIYVKHREHCPRLFLARGDGSGTELLSSHTVEELLYQAYSDPSIALLKEPLSDTQDDFGITILKPSHQNVWSQWLQGKQIPDITPPNLRNRSWHDFPKLEKKSPGPSLGTDMGRGLTLSERPGGSAAQRQPVRSCPKVLEMRELYQHRPFTTPLKNTIDTRLKEYIKSLMEREQRSEKMKVKEPRTEEESVHASDLLNLVLSFAEEEDAGHTFDKRTAEDISLLYNQGVGAPIEQSDVSEDTITVTSDSFTQGKESKWTDRLAQHRQEVSEEQACREALRNMDIVPFFHPENIQLYQNLLQHQSPDMRSLSMNLPPFPKSDGAEAFLTDAPQESTPRPLNPTPSQSASLTSPGSSALSYAAGDDRMIEERPTNPTPQTAGESSLRGSSGQRRSVQLDVTGKLRRTKVRLPTSILSSKPRSIPNQQFLSVEEPVRRRCRTISLTDPNVIVRGFQLLPSSIDFGTLQEGTSSAVTVVMKNVGVDTCRFYVKQPPPATGLRVLYSPGPVPAGLHVELQVQLFATFAVQAGEAEPKRYISQDIVIHTETDILYLPVSAILLPERLYDIWVKEHTGTHTKKGSRVRQLSASLPVRYPQDQPCSKQETP